MQEDQIQDLEVLLGHNFRDKSFLVNALSHSSIKSEQRPSNERLEYLGDSVLGLIVSDALYRRYPEDDEGTLTRIKSQAVSRSTLQRVAVVMSLDRFILVGKGVAKKEIPASLLGNLFEALVGAIYLDAGLAAARKFVLRHLDVVISEIVEDRAERNYKSMLQHHCQREMGTVPVYRVLREVGPAHDRNFDVAVSMNGREYGRARGVSKKEAEQGAARAALLHLRAVDETPRQPVRGAGTILRIGPPDGGGSGRGGKGRRGRKGEAEPGHTRGAEAQSSRRGGRAEAEAAGGTPAKKKRRRRKKKGPEGVAEGPPATPPPAAEKQAAPASPASGDGEGGAAKKKSRRRRRRKRNGGAEPAAPQ